MSLSLSELKTKADNLIKQFGDSAASDKAIQFQPLDDTTPDSGNPYYEDPNKTYGTAVTVIAWMVKDPVDPHLPVQIQELIKIGEHTNVDAMFYVSELENVRKGTVFTENLRDGRFLHLGNKYDLLSCKPAAHVHGEPVYWRFLTVRAP